MRPVLCVLLLLLLVRPCAAAPFGVAAHANVNIEWWYVNAHVTTKSSHHYALIGSFFRFGDGTSPFDGVSPAPRAHYLIYAVTDLDNKTQRSYSLVDQIMVNYVKQIAPLLAAARTDKQAREFVSALNAGLLPSPHQLIAGVPKIVNSPFRLAYGTDNSLTADNPANTAYTLHLDGGTDKITLHLASQKPAMAVGGSGETGLKKKNDMFYFSLTRCTVAGQIDTGAGPDIIQSGAAWFDHQWGNSWVASDDGWDWWGIQLSDGTDILCFRQRDLATGKVFFPLATFMDGKGKQAVTKNIIFSPDPHSLWTSPTTGVRYPLRWRLTFPALNRSLLITTPVPAQEMPVFGPGGSIWEGSCDVQASPTALIEMGPSLKPMSKEKEAEYFKPVPGTAYMELVGYNSPAVKKTTGR